MKKVNFNGILKFLAPKDTKFYPLFEQYSKLLVETSSQLKKLARKGEVGTEAMEKIKELETIGDRLNYTIQTELNRSFITPFDREDIQKLSSTLDDVLDYIYGAAQKIYDYEPKNFMEEFVLLSEIINKTCKELDFCVTRLKTISTHKDEIFASCDKINKLEKDADDIFHKGISRLFKDEVITNELVKNKGILETLEKTVDYAEDVSDIIQTILVKEV